MRIRARKKFFCGGNEVHQKGLVRGSARRGFGGEPRGTGETIKRFRESVKNLEFFDSFDRKFAI